MNNEDTLSQLRERLAQLEIEHRKILIAIEVITGEEPDETSLSVPTTGIILGDSGQVAPRQVKPGAVSLRPDTFFGMSAHQAAKTYLKMVNHADKLENIFNAINGNGVTIGGANPLETLRATLSQNTAAFVRVAPGTFGLREFYPHLGNKGPEKPQRGKLKQKNARHGKAAAKQKTAKTKSRKTSKDNQIAVDTLAAPADVAETGE